MISPRSQGRRLPLYTARALPIPRWKRSLDLACCAIVLPLFALCIFVVWLFMGMLSPGPLFFRQERVGYRGRKFMLYKFRTMHIGADTASHRAHFSDLVRANRPMQKLDGAGDTRLIKGGWLLRASGFDELPQILNVLRGDMSLVGPRPCIPYEYEQYTPAQRGRFESAPGLTGLWQVSGKNRTTFEEMTRMDIHYARNASLWLDLKIMARTIPALCVQIADTHRQRRRSAAPKPSHPVAQPAASEPATLQA